MKQCKFCKSIWVCWNWVHAKDGWWGHECWDCGNVQETKHKVKNGLPYWILKHFHKYLGVTCEHKNRELLPLGNKTKRGTELCLKCGRELIHKTNIVVR